MNNDLLKAILAMDSYNRSYNEGIVVTGTALSSINILQKNINGVAVDFDSQVLGVLPKENPEDPDVRKDADIGFYAIAYEYQGEVIISYRGTDSGLLDDLKGFGVGGGYATSGAQPGAQPLPDRHTPH